MAVSTVCATCRLRALIRQQSLARQRRQWLSYTPRRRQEQHAGGYVDTLYEKFDRSLQQPRRPSRRQNGGPPGSAIRENGDRVPTVGRYSRKPLQDEQQNDERALHQRPRPRYEAERPIQGHYSRPVRDGRHHAEQSARRRSQQSCETARAPRELLPEPPQPSQQLLEDLAAPHQRRQNARARHDDDREAAVMMPHELSEDAPPPIPTARDHVTLQRDIQKGDFSASSLSNKTWQSLPWQMSKAAERFMHSNDDALKWTHLQDMVKHAGNINRMQTLGTDRYFNRAFFHYIGKMTDVFVSSADAVEPSASRQHLPDPAVLLRIRSATTEDSSTMWPSVLWTLAKNVAILRVNGDESSQSFSKRVLQESMAVWSLCMKAQAQKGRKPAQLHSMEVLLDRPQVDFSFLPDPSQFQESLQERGSYYDLAEILDFLVPPLSMSSKQRDFDYSSAALVTLDVLRNEQGTIDQSYQQWTKMMETVIQCVTEKSVPDPLRRAAADAESEQVKRYFLSLIYDKFRLRGSPWRPPAVESEASAPADESVPSEQISEDKRTLLQSLEAPPALVKSSSEFDRFVYDAVENLGRALEQNKPVYAQRTWQNVQENAAKYPGIPTPIHLYERLLVTFIAMRDQQHVLEIWKAMLKDGHKPTVKTYSIIMQGCRYVSDVKTLEAFWSSMRNAGLRPDGHAWSTRIYALLKSRQIDAGLRCLAEMSQEWIAAARQAHAKHLPAETKQKKKTTEHIPSGELVQRYSGSINGVPRPDLVVMNAAVSALAAVNDKEIPKVLGWARSFGIEPDLTTYNALLNVAMREGHPDEALRILRRMESKDIQADGTTWTVLLTALFQGGFLDELEPEAQQERILTFISSLEAINAANIDSKGYALIIDRLLKQHANMPAADAVLKHMSAKDIKPTPHIYTILMSAYFNPPNPDTPPDFRAIESLWNSIRTANSGYGTPLDAQFYDRMIEGYAAHHAAYGSTKPVHHFLQRMQNEGKKPSWKALTAAVRAFAAKGEWERARGVVGRVRWEVEGSRALGQRFGQREFWGMCVEMGLIGGGEVPRLGEREGGSVR